MAKVKFIVQSKKEAGNIYAQFSINRQTVLKRKTGFDISLSEWNKKTGFPMGRNDNSKKLKSNLKNLEILIEDTHNIDVNKGIEFTGEWLQELINKFNNKTPLTNIDYLTNCIQKYIDDAPYKENQKKETGLTVGRVQNIKLFKSTILRYEAKTPSKKQILIKDINLQFVEKFKAWLFEQNYSANYVGKNIANLKTILIDAEKNGIKLSINIKNIKRIAESKTPEQIIYLTEQEQEQIKKATLLREAHKNARRWLLLGCLIGQRGSDLLSIKESNIKEIQGFKIIELKQQKTGKLVAIPLIPEALEIINDGLPYEISLTKFNQYLKDICEIAELNNPIKGRIKEKSRSATTFKTLEKFNFISSHVCRRSFATNFYGRIPTPVLMNITAHGTEEVFLKYIGKTTYDNAYQMLEYFSKLAPKDKTPQLEVIHNTGTK
jgi:integrase